MKLWGLLSTEDSNGGPTKYCYDIIMKIAMEGLLNIATIL